MPADLVLWLKLLVKWPRDEICSVDLKQLPFGEEYHWELISYVATACRVSGQVSVIMLLLDDVFSQLERILLVCLV